MSKDVIHETANILRWFRNDVRTFRNAARRNDPQAMVSAAYYVGDTGATARVRCYSTALLEYGGGKYDQAHRIRERIRDRWVAANWPDQS